MILHGRAPIAGALLCLLAGVAGWGAGPALAAAPEPPQAEVQSHTATSVDLRGVLSPNAAGREGAYEFMYAASSSTCTGESKGPRGLSFGFQGEEVYEELSGLASHTTYTICLLDRNNAGEETLSPSVTVTTSFEPQAPQTGSADAVMSSSAVLHGELYPNPGGEKELRFFEFIYRRSANECEGEGAEPTGQISAEHEGVEKEAVEHEIAGLAPNTQYTFCLRAWNATGQSAIGAPVTFTTLAAKPSISGEVISKVGTAGAIVATQIETGGLPTTYSVQYGTTSGYGSETTPVSAASGTQTVTVTIQGLQRNTLYHARFTATNTQGSQQGGDFTFTTYPPETGLPDGRVYEMVTPPSNSNGDVNEMAPLNGGLLPSNRPYEASPDGGRVAYVDTGAVAGGNGSEEVEYVAARSSKGGWAQTDITPVGSTIGTGYQGFTLDLSAGVLGTLADPPFTTINSLPELPDTDESAVESLFSHTFAGEEYSPLFRRRPPYIERGAFRAFSELRIAKETQPLYAGSSADGSHLFFQVEGALLEGEGALERELNAVAEKEAEAMAEAKQLKLQFGELSEFEQTHLHDELYMNVDGALSLVNVLPDGKVAPGADFGGVPKGHISDCNCYTTPGPGLDHAISDDGSRVFWSEFSDRWPGQIEYNKPIGEFVPGIVYVRENGTRTVQVSEGPAVFQDATPDGKYAFYIEAGKLWRFDVGAGTRAEPVVGVGGVQGVVGINETGADGAYVYFVSEQALGVAGVSPAGQAPVAGADNLYVSEPNDTGGSRVAFIGALSSADGNDWVLQLGHRVANITPDGHALSFTALENLTGGSYPGEGAEEVYVYDANGSSLVCASCRPQASGGRMQTSESIVYEYRRISEDGNEVFFESAAPLVAQDVNGVQDVYEWERDGSGDCHETSGCAYMLSNGFEGTAFMLDAGVSGGDVFIITRQRLTPEDGNENVDLYDARVNGVRSVVAPQCSGTGCQGPPASAPIFATPSSVTFNGVGNFSSPASVQSGTKPRALTRAQKLSRALALCRKQHVRKRQFACERHARKAYGYSARKSTHRRGK